MNNFIKIFDDEKDVLAAFSLRSAGSLKKNSENQKKFFEQFDIGLDKVVFMNQVHGSNVQYVDGLNNLIEKTDGIFTDKKGIYLAVNTADCLPIFIYSSNPKFVGVIHGGWRCLTAGVIEMFFKIVSEKFDLNYKNIKAVIGPGIRSCHFEIKDDVLDQFQQFTNYIINKKNKIFIDLQKITLSILTKIGLEEYNLKLWEDCTFCNEKKYFSYRREKKNLKGEMLGFIGLI